MNMDRRLDGCDNEWSQAVYGFTYFKKIRINLTSLIVDSKLIIQKNKIILKIELLIEEKD